MIKNIDVTNDQITIQGKNFSKFHSLFVKPCDSRDLNIYSVKKRINPELITVTTDVVK